MKLTRRQLNQIVEENLLDEGILDDLKSGFDAIFQDDEEDASGERYAELEKGVKKQTDAMNKAQKAGGMVAQVLNTLGVTLQAVKKILAFFGVEEIGESFSERIAPIHIACLWNFICLKQSPFELDSDKNRRALYYVCKAAERRGSKSKINYEDFYKAQTLDPDIPKGQEKPVPYSSSGPVTNPLNPGTYTSLAFALGECDYKKSGSGYYVYDRYRYFISAKKKSFKITQGYAVSLENIGKVLKINFEDIMSFLGAALLNKKSDVSLHRAIEDLCLMYETTLGYNGYMISCNTISGEEKESPAVAKSSKKSKGLNSDVFPGGKWNNQAWASFIDANVDESELPEGLSIKTLKTDWKKSSKILKYDSGIKGINDFIDDAEDGEFKPGLASRLISMATGDA